MLIGVLKLIEGVGIILAVIIAGLVFKVEGLGHVQAVHQIWPG
jgi:hypothetical protein